MNKNLEALSEPEEFNQKKLEKLLSETDVSHVDVFKNKPTEIKKRSAAFKKAQKKRKKKAYLSRKANR